MRVGKVHSMQKEPLIPIYPYVKVCGVFLELESPSVSGWD